MMGSSLIRTPVCWLMAAIACGTVVSRFSLTCSSSALLINAWTFCAGAGAAERVRTRARMMRSMGRIMAVLPRTSRKTVGEKPRLNSKGCCNAAIGRVNERDEVLPGPLLEEVLRLHDVAHCLGKLDALRAGDDAGGVRLEAAGGVAGGSADVDLDHAGGGRGAGRG